MINNQTVTPERLLKLRQVMATTGLSRSSIFLFTKSGKFPKPIKLSERSTAWLESEIQQWIADRVADRGL